RPRRATTPATVPPPRSRPRSARGAPQGTRWSETRTASRFLVPRRGLAVAELLAGRLDHLREADHGHGVLVGDVLTVDLAQEADRLVETAELGVVVLDVTGGEVAHAFHLDVVDHRGEDLF